MELTEAQKWGDQLGQATNAALRYLLEMNPEGSPKHQAVQSIVGHWKALKEFTQMTADRRILQDLSIDATASVRWN
jgi:hypothetical protein